MTEQQKGYSSVTAVLPTSRSGAVIDDMKTQPGASALFWRARGSLLQDRWWHRWVTPISPAKTILQMLVPDQDVARVIDMVVTKGRLHQQATGAVFSIPCDSVTFGPDYHHWPEQSSPAQALASPGLRQDLSIIYCIVGQNRSNRVCRAAINAGAHGPIVHYCEGRGLRDRLGWLRITKEHDQEVLIVMVDRRRVDEVFEAMAKAGEFHLPGRGLMYHHPVDNGMLNLPSRVSANNYDANMQQVIRAIDHLSGHSHWRDQGLGDPRGHRAQTVTQSTARDAALSDQIRLSALVKRSEADAFTDLVLDAGVPGLTMVQTFFTAAQEGCKIAGARVNDEYALYRCILDPGVATHVRSVIQQHAADRGVHDFCVFGNAVPRVARYIAGAKDHRTQGIALLPDAPPQVVREG